MPVGFDRRFAIPFNDAPYPKNPANPKSGYIASFGTLVVAQDGSGDFEKIQPAIDELPAGGGIVLIKEGTWTITSAITITGNNVVLRGSGRGTKIQTSGNINAIEVQHTGNMPIIENIYFRGSGNGNNTNTGIYLNSGEKAIIKDCYFENFGQFVINNLTSDEAIIINNIIRINYASGILVQCDNNVVMGNVVVDNYGTATGINITASTVDNTIVVGNYANNNATANFANKGTDTQIGHNIFTT